MSISVNPALRFAAFRGAARGGQNAQLHAATVTQKSAQEISDSPENQSRFLQLQTEGFFGQEAIPGVSGQSEPVSNKDLLVTVASYVKEHPYQHSTRRYSLEEADELIATGNIHALVQKLTTTGMLGLDLLKKLDTAGLIKIGHLCIPTRASVPVGVAALDLIEKKGLLMHMDFTDLVKIASLDMSKSAEAPKNHGSFPMSIEMTPLGTYALEQLQKGEAS